MARFSGVACIVVFTLLALSFQLGEAASCPVRPLPPQPPLDYFLFVQQWPGSYCKTQKSCCLQNPSNPEALFSIHGLWPQYLPDSASGRLYPECCDVEDVFNPDTISDLQPNLDTIWDSLKCGGTDASFWAHEWEKHGTCALSEIGHEHAYFSAAIKLYETVNITGALEAGGIVPSESVTYSSEEISAAIQDGIGASAVLICKKAQDRQDRSKYLFEVRVCVDKDAETLIDCPANNENCFGRISFPLPPPVQRSATDLASVEAAA